MYWSIIKAIPWSSKWKVSTKWCLFGVKHKGPLHEEWRSSLISVSTVFRPTELDVLSWSEYRHFTGDCILKWKDCLLLLLQRQHLCSVIFPLQQHNHQLYHFQPFSDWDKRSHQGHLTMVLNTRHFIEVSQKTESKNWEKRKTLAENIRPWEMTREIWPCLEWQGN